jgi:hypothetical protein
VLRCPSAGCTEAVGAEVVISRAGSGAATNSFGALFGAATNSDFASVDGGAADVGAGSAALAGTAGRLVSPVLTGISVFGLVSNIPPFCRGLTDAAALGGSLPEMIAPGSGFGGCGFAGSGAPAFTCWQTMSFTNTSSEAIKLPAASNVRQFANLDS